MLRSTLNHAMDPHGPESIPHLALIAPCFNEGDVAVRFVHELNDTLAGLAATWTFVLVDDGSTDDTLERLRSLAPIAPNIQLELLALPFNMGHQRAILQGLLHASSSKAERFVVMDADGEDDPHALHELIDGTQPPIVLVARGARSGSFLFKLGYRFYRILFATVTGKRMIFGNYSMIDRTVLHAVLSKGFVHYAACLSKLQNPTRIITYDRRPRFDGDSKMDLRSLSLHAFRSLIEYSEEVLAFFLKAFLILTLIFSASMVTIVCIKLFTENAIPGWASTLCLSLFNSMLVCLGFFAVGLLLVNSSLRRGDQSQRLYRVVR
ncbi:MAG TPA: glycosyltransferase [Flavobacteriales bacterium]|jgi:glycosyltransferase involved in cell wall biosynthesis|nr:glycosyltransferase [Flavobacteriales bacterium]MBK7101853.1 glycosyltransferase [Flavobacteriales bacterium]MBK7114201.1 glycosyltransferase [Flavobacteriales bacterium]MBK7483746.1 glycosyltransferase [Flavobacteriales bacterium]MBK7620104.1 glycosyltransferase [Flavobacteriales bacterium]